MISQYSDKQVPGISSTKTLTPRQLGLVNKKVIRKGVTMNGAKSRDPGNSPVTELRAGMLFGKITSGGKYGTSIIGKTTLAYDGSTTLTVSAAVAVEIVRRIGSTGTFKVTGPPTAAGTVRTLTITYSSVNTTSGAITVTAASVNEVQTVTPTGDASAGSFTLWILRPTGVWGSTGPLAYTASAGTIQTALDLASGVANGVVNAGTTPFDTPNAMTLTFSGTGYAGLPQTLAIVDYGTSPTGNTTMSVARTTAGVDGRFVTDSLVQPTDGSETIKGMWNARDGFPVKAVDEDGTDRDISLGELIIGADWCEVANFLNYPADASTRAWLKAQLRAVSPGWAFDDDFYA